jgi:hypothetical protein
MMNIYTKRVRPRYRKHRVKENANTNAIANAKAKAVARGTQKVWHIDIGKKSKDKGRRRASSNRRTHLSLHDATLKVRHLYDTVRDFDVEAIHKWRNMRKRIQRGKPVHDGGGPAEDAQTKLDSLNKKLEDARKLQETLKQQLDETVKAVAAAGEMKREIKSEMEAAKEGATPDDPNCVEYQGQPTFLVKKKPGGPDEYDVTRVNGDTHVDGSLTRLAESLIGRAKKVGGVDEDGEEYDSNAVAKAAYLDAIAEEMIKIALDALDKVDAFEGAKELTDDKILEQAAAAILAIAVGGLLNKSGSALELSDTTNVVKLIVAIASAYTAFYPDGGSGSGSVPFPEIFKGISSSSSTSSSAPASPGTKSEEDKIQLLRDLIGAYINSTLSDTSKYPNYGTAKTQLQTFLSALGKK